MGSKTNRWDTLLNDETVKKEFQKWLNNDGSDPFFEISNELFKKNDLKPEKADLKYVFYFYCQRIMIFMIFIIIKREIKTEITFL